MWGEGKVFPGPLKAHPAAHFLFSLPGGTPRQAGSEPRIVGLQQESPATRTVHHPITRSIVSLFTLRCLHLPRPCSPPLSTGKLTLPPHTLQSHPVLRHLGIPLVSVNNMLHFNYTFRNSILNSQCPFWPTWYHKPGAARANYGNRNVRAAN